MLLISPLPIYMIFGAVDVVLEYHSKTFFTDMLGTWQSPPQSNPLGELCGNVGQSLHQERFNYLGEGSNRACYRIYETGPCSTSMKFYPHPDSDTAGYCDCDREQQRPLVYVKEEKRCYPIYTQAVCQKGFWLTFDSKRKIPHCAQNPCYKLSNDTGTSSYVLHHGICHQIGQFSANCQRNEVIGFRKGRVLPACVEQVAGLTAIAVPVIKCPAGSVLAVTGKCQPKFEFEF